MKKTRISVISALLAGLAISLSAYANEAELREVDIPQDLASITRGAETVTSVCMGCHSLKYIKYRDLVHLGIAKDKVDEWRAGQPLETALTSSMTPDVARASFNGVVPPDLSLMANARDGRGRYLFSYLTGYHKNDKGELTNTVFPVTRMPDVLGAADAADAKSRGELDEKAKDVAAFLVWAADPHAMERTRMGYYVLGYLAVLTLLLFVWKKKIWRDIDKQPKIK
jgi:ubiquinol-cytochrome c reductase cytochrome c1 subunit